MYYLMKTLHTPNIYEKTEAESNRELQRKKGMKRERQSQSQSREREKLKKPMPRISWGQGWLTADFWGDMSGISH